MVHGVHVALYFIVSVRYWLFDDLHVDCDGSLHWQLVARCRMKMQYQLRIHYHCGLMQAVTELGWTPEFSLLDGLKDSYDKDFGRGTYRKEADFAADDIVLSKVK